MNETQKMIAVQPVISYLADQLPWLDRDELIGEGQIIALQAIRKHREGPGKQSLASFVRTCVWRRFLSSLRSHAWQKRMTKPNTELGLKRDEPVRPGFNLRSWMLTISNQAQEVVRIAIAQNTKKTPLIRHLARIGWNKAKIRQTFQEIREALP